MDSMKHLLIAAGLVGAVALTTTANAQVSDLAQRVGSSSLKIGSYNPDKPVVRNGAGKNIFNFEYETTLQSVPERNEISTLSVGLIERGDMRIIPITLSQITRDNKRTSGYDWFSGYGVGLYAIRIDNANTSGNTKVMPGMHVTVGVNLTTRSFVEARYHFAGHYETINPSGLNISYGTRF